MCVFAIFWLNEFPFSQPQVWLLAWSLPWACATLASCSCSTRRSCCSGPTCTSTPDSSSYAQCCYLYCFIPRYIVCSALNSLVSTFLSVCCFAVYSLSIAEEERSSIQWETRLFVYYFCMFGVPRFMLRLI
jgi:hypothetical protein